MKYNITLEDLKTVNHDIYKNIVGNEHEIDFFSLLQFLLLALNDVD